jgi:hypothetical protein
MDPMSPCVLKASASVAIYNGEIAIIIHHTFNASMRKQQYQVLIMFNKNNVISCKCSCRVGSDDNENVGCVHTLPVLLQFSVLLLDGLAEHCLFELSNTWYSSDYSTIGIENINSIKKIQRYRVPNR